MESSQKVINGKHSSGERKLELTALGELITSEGSPRHCWKPLQQHCPVECSAMMEKFQAIRRFKYG